MIHAVLLELIGLVDVEVLIDLFFLLFLSDFVDDVHLSVVLRGTINVIIGD